jgi:hypothetical protein
VLVTASEEEAGGYIAGLYQDDQEECADGRLCATVDEVVKHVRRWFGIPDDLMLGVYNVTAAARDLIEVHEREAEREGRDRDAMIEEDLEALAIDAMADYSRGDDLAHARYEALKAEVQRLQSEEVQS